jgi:Putative DNA-binding domain/NB-ARC domain
MKSGDSLHSAIFSSLKFGEKSPAFDDTLLSSDRTRVNQKNETDLWDYKETVNLNDKADVAKLAKHVLAFHNHKGGCIVIGVRKDYVVTGMPANAIGDQKQLRDALRKYVGNLEVFQDQVSTHRAGRVLWLVFVPPRTGSPVATQSNAPDPIVGNRLFHKGQYFIRVGDESRLAEPSNYELLWRGISFTHLTAYEYDTDEPNFLLLSPHHDQLIGRLELKDKLYDLLNARSYIVSLDGVGGVGKSALAIEVVKDLYLAEKYEFIVSLSAKAKVWQHQGAEGRKAQFTGLGEFLREIARVLYPGDSWNSLESLRSDLIELMEGSRGLLFVDNLENVSDDNVIEFLRDIPKPVKVLITSKVRRGALPADVLFVPELTQEEGRLLLTHELKRLEFNSALIRSDIIDQIVSAAGRLPLAIKWAASLALNNNSLPNVLAEFDRGGLERSEFLNYCFSEMVGGLSPTARDCALLCPYLPDEAWNATMLSFALGKNHVEIAAAIDELEDRGLIIRGTHAEKRFVLPLTMDYLSDLLRKNKRFRPEVDRRLSDAIPEANNEFYSMPAKRKAELLYNRAMELTNEGKFDLAAMRLELASQFSREGRGDLAIKCACLDARLRERRGEHRAAIDEMRLTLSQVENVSQFANDFLWLGGQILKFGGRHERNEGMQQVISAIHAGATEPIDAVETFCENAAGQDDDESKLCDAIRGCKDGRIARVLLEAVKEKLRNDQFLFTVGKEVVSALAIAKAHAPTDAERKELQALHDHAAELAFK